MHIDPGQVGGTVTDRAVHLLTGERASLGPLRLVPAEGQHDRQLGGPGEARHRVQCFGQAGRRGEVETAGGEAGLAP